jgi:hypothetical protein
MVLKILHIETGHNTPDVLLNPDTGDLTFTGKSIPENATRLYSPVIDWVKKYIEVAMEETNLHLDLDYFNTGSSIWIAKIFKELSQINDLDKLVLIHLYFHVEEFDAMEEQDLADMISPISDVLKNSLVSIGVKVYGKDESNSVKKERLILF